MKKPLPQSFTKSIGKFVLMGSKLNLFIVLLLISSLSFAQTKSATQNKKQVNWRDMGKASKGVNFYSIEKNFNQYWENKTPAKGQGFKPYKRWQAYMAPRVYPSGDRSLPSSTYGNYMEWMQTSTLKSATANTSNWTSLGPNTVPAGYDSGAGRVDWVRFDPNNSDIIYVGTPDGGLWKSTTGGTSWSTNTDFLPIIGCADLAIDPTNTQTMYLATGNWEHDRSSIGVLKSIDGGTSWNPTGLTFGAADGVTIQRLLMHPTNSSILLVSTAGGNGIYRTTDGGDNWSQPTTDDYLGDMVFKPGDPNTVYATSNRADDYGIYKSTDNGATWTKKTSGLPLAADVSRVVLGVTAANSAYVYALVGNTNSGYRGLFRSTDNGETYTEMSNINSVSGNILHADAVPPTSGTGWNGGQATHDLAIAIAPDNADKVTIGGINQWRSMDGGATWSLFTHWLGYDPDYPDENEQSVPYTHADIQSITYLPESSTTMFVTSDGGIYKTTNDGALGSWTDLSNGLAIAQQTSVAVSQSETGYYITGLQDIGVIQKDGGTWKVINGGDGEDCLIRRDNGDYNITSGPNGGFYYSDDKGKKKYKLTGRPAADGEWLSPVNQDPVNDALVYFGGWPALYKTETLWSTNEAAPWTTLGLPAGTGNILSFAVAPSNTQIIYAIKINAISKSTNSGATWTNITGTLPVGSTGLSNLTVSNTDPDKVWVTFSGYSDGNKVFKTENAGTAWTNISTGLPNLPMTTIVYQNNTANDAVYLGADIGIYYMNNTTPWEPFNTGLPNCNVRDLEIDYPNSKLMAATYGRGLWVSALNPGLTSLTWAGTTDTDWNTGTNWIGGQVPGSTDNIIIPAGAPNYPTLDAAVTINDLTIESTSASSGSLLGQHNLTLTGITTIKRQMSGGKWHLVASSAPGQSIASFLAGNTNVPTIDPDRGMLDYKEDTNEWNNFFTNATPGNIEAGKGYLLRIDADSTVSFTGTLQTGTVTPVVSRTADFGWNAVGNPYPSAIAINTASGDFNFIGDNSSNLDGNYTAIYVWDPTSTSYAIINLGDAPAFYAQLGQGFMVKAATGATQVDFTTDMQTHQPTAAFKSATVSGPQIILAAEQDGQRRTTRLDFKDNMNLGLDIGYDAGVFKTGFDLYTELVERS